MVSNYVFDDAWLEERSRPGSLEAALDPGTIAQLALLGVGPGWNCLEAGAGAGSIASWLCQRVGSSGHVVACDLQTTFLQNLNRPNLEIWCHDMVTGTLPERRFDLAYVRWTLHWPPGRSTALASHRLRCRHPGRAIRNAPSSQRPRLHHLQPHDHRSLGTPSPLTSQMAAGLMLS